MSSPAVAPRHEGSGLAFVAVLLLFAAVAALSVLASPLVCVGVLVGGLCLVFAVVKIEAVLLGWLAFSAVLQAVRLLPYERHAGYGFTLAGEFLLVFLPAAIYQLAIARRYGRGGLKPFIPVVAYALSTALWIPWAVDTLEAVRRSVYWTGFFLFAALAYHYGKSLAGTRRIVAAIVVSALVVCAVSGAQLVFGLGIGAPTKGLMRGLFDHKNILGYFLITVLPLTVALGFTSKGIQRLAWFSLNGVLLLTLFFSLSRAAWLGAIASLFVIPLFFRGGKRWTLALGLTVLIALTAAGAWLVLREDLYGSSYYFRTTVLSRAVDLGTYSTRAQVWRGLYYFVSRHPDQWTFGHGPGAAVEIINTASYMPHVSSTHNLYLRLFVEAGGVGLLLFLLLAAWLVRRLVECARSCSVSLDRALCAAALATLAAHLVFNLAGDEFTGMTVTPLLWAQIGLAFAARERALDSAPPPATRASHLLPLPARQQLQHAFESVPVAENGNARPHNRVSSWNAERDDKKG
ncbi:MAG: O-antigen ligase family protein [Planctomycetes bacterium]|nr:O-antigen ligase family protein [Planctomycetota bacterium]MBI3845860.1 O-antigen ligase family protein [Planctomycetota bacterium]